MNDNITSKRPFNKLASLSLKQIQIDDDFWNERLEVNNKVTLYAIYQKMLEDHHIDNFRVVTGEKMGVHQGMFFNDSDLYKWMEAACYSFYYNDDPELRGTIDALIYIIQKAQMPNGYLNTFFTNFFPERRWKDTIVLHELYCAGHLIQAAIAHYQATENVKFLNIAIKFADLIVRAFSPGKYDKVPGHEEIEMALIDLYRVTRFERYLKMAKVFIERRGNVKKLPIKFLLGRIETVKLMRLSTKNRERFFKAYPSKKVISATDTNLSSDFAQSFNPYLIIRGISQLLNGKYMQHHKPVKEQSKAVGHAVRAVYLYCGMADLYTETGDESILVALRNIWNNMTKRRMYITGSIGSLPMIEAFGKDYELPNQRSYAETCAAIGSIMWNWRMLQITGDCKYADLIERILYNGFLVGISLDGKLFSYRNILASDGRQVRNDWYEVACCPPNIARMMASVARYIYSVSEEGLWVHQYIGSKVSVNLRKGIKIELVQKSEFPWKGNVKFRIKLSSPKEFSIMFRIPSWCKNRTYVINNEEKKHKALPGNYLQLKREWNNNDVIEFEFLMVAKFNKSHPSVKSNRGRVAISCGPLVYCLESHDNRGIDILNDKISPEYHLKITNKPDLLGNVNIIRGKMHETNKEFIAIPYFMWGNREPCAMQVWNRIEEKRD